MCRRIYGSLTLHKTLQTDSAHAREIPSRSLLQSQMQLVRLGARVPSRYPIAYATVPLKPRVQAAPGLEFRV